MKCEDRDPDLLLFGLGDLSFWRRQATAYHLRRCSRCRAREAELAATSVRIADVLRPPAGTGPGRGPGLPLRLHPRRYVAWPVALVIVLGMVAVTTMTVWYVRTHVPVARGWLDPGCRPDLPNDLCR